MRSAATLGLGLFCMHGAAMGRIVSYEELPFSTVTAAETCGSWRVDNKVGEFRVLQAYMYAGTRVFVDMISVNERGLWLEVTRGFTFSELNDDHLEYELSDIGCSQLAINRIAVTGRATPLEGLQFAFRLELDGVDGSYTFSRTTADRRGTQRSLARKLLEDDDAHVLDYEDCHRWLCTTSPRPYTVRRSRFVEVGSAPP